MESVTGKTWDGEDAFKATATLRKGLELTFGKQLEEIQYFYLIESEFKPKLDVLKLVMKKVLQLMQDHEKIDYEEIRKQLTDEAKQLIDKAYDDTSYDGLLLYFQHKPNGDKEPINDFESLIIHQLNHQFEEKKKAI